MNANKIQISPRLGSLLVSAGAVNQHWENVLVGFAYPAFRK